MAGSIITRGWDPEQLAPGLAQVVYAEGENDLSVYKQCVDMKPASISPLKTGVKTHRIAGLGVLEDVGETTPTAYDAPKPGSVKESHYRSFGLSVAFSRIVKDDELYGILGEVAGELGKAYDRHRNISVATLYENFFANTYYTDAEGTQPLGSAAHTCIKATNVTRSNILPVSKEFSLSSVTEMLVKMSRQKDDLGLPSSALKPGQSVKLLIQPEDKATFIKLFAGGNGLDPTNDTNAPNPLKNWGNTFTSVENNWIDKVGSARYWFALLPETNYWMIDRTPLESKVYTENSNDVLVHRVFCRYGIHIRHWTGGYGSGN